MADDMMTRIGAAVELGRAGDKAGASQALATLWDEIGDDGDAFHRCALAHYMADVQDDLQSELEWDERALVAVRSVSDARAQEHHESLQVRAFMPSLFLNLADDHRRLGNADRAREYLEQARNSAGALGDDDYGVMIEGAITTVEKGPRRRFNGAAPDPIGGSRQPDLGNLLSVGQARRGARRSAAYGRTGLRA